VCVVCSGVESRVGYDRAQSCQVRRCVTISDSCRGCTACSYARLTAYRGRTLCAVRGSREEVGRGKDGGKEIEMSD
jgi:hypothetical protein